MNIRRNILLLGLVCCWPVVSQADIPLVASDATPPKTKLQVADVTGVAPAAAPAAPAVTDDEGMVYVKKRRKPLSVLYKRIFTALEQNGYFILIEPNIGKNLSYFAQRWGNDYNRNKLEEIRSMVFCNAWYANKISNADPHMLALCPLHITLIQKGKLTTIVFVRPGKVAINSPARGVAEEMEKDVIRIIENAV